MESVNLLSKERVKKNQIKSSGILGNIKSKYILKNVFNNLETIKSLNFIKYNNIIKKRMDININDYKEYIEKYSSIEIEIKPVINEYGKFINIKKEDEKYYHIYFNNNKEEVKRNYINKTRIKIIKIIIDYNIKSFQNLFGNSFCIESIDFKKFYRNNINNMCGMFYGCSSLKKLNLNNFNTNNVTNMRDMFFNCSSLEELNLDNFITNNVIDIGYMFCGCSSLKKLNLNNFNTSNVIDMNLMFSECSSLKVLNLSNFDTNKVSYMRRIFYKCSNELIMKIKTQYKNIKEETFINND